MLSIVYMHLHMLFYKRVIMISHHNCNTCTCDVTALIVLMMNVAAAKIRN